MARLSVPGNPGIEQVCTFTNGIPGLGVLPGGDAPRPWKCAEIAATGSKGPYTFELVPGPGDDFNSAFAIGTMINDETVNLMTTAPWGPSDPQESDRPLSIRVKCTDVHGKYAEHRLIVLD